jgi:hypothetical protein
MDPNTRTRLKGGAVRQSGIWQHPSGVLGASPDGTVDTTSALRRDLISRSTPKILEVKCSYSAREYKTIDEAVSKIVRSKPPFFFLERGDCRYRSKETSVLSPNPGTVVHHKQVMR